MKTHLSLLLCLLVTLTASAQTPSAATNSNTSDNMNAAAAKPKPKRGPVFRATKDQIMQAQKMLKTGNMYTGEATGKLDSATRAALKKYQTAEGLKVTGTLNKVTLEKMGVALTDKQKTM